MVEMISRKKKISTEEEKSGVAGEVVTNPIPANVVVETMFEPVKSKQIEEKIVPKVVDTPVMEVYPKSLKPEYALALTEKRGFKFVTKILSKGTHDECTLAMTAYRKKFGVSRNEKLFVAKV